MNATTGVLHRYDRGDEVVVVLDGAEAYNIERGAAVEPGCLPSWTIGVVLDQRERHGAATYVLRIEHDACVCLCMVGEGAIQGLA